jgi:hypothetical protein
VRLDDHVADRPDSQRVPDLERVGGPGGEPTTKRSASSRPQAPTGRHVRRTTSTPGRRSWWFPLTQLKTDLLSIGTSDALRARVESPFKRAEVVVHVGLSGSTAQEAGSFSAALRRFRAISIEEVASSLSWEWVGRFCRTAPVAGIPGSISNRHGTQSRTVVDVFPELVQGCGARDSVETNG